MPLNTDHVACPSSEHERTIDTEYQDGVPFILTKKFIFHEVQWFLWAQTVRAQQLASYSTQVSRLPCTHE